VVILKNIDDLIVQLAKRDMIIVVMKANVGYSVVPVPRSEYAEKFLLREHYNGKSVIEAIERLLDSKVV